MAGSVISKLPQAAQRELLEDLNYLNLKEMKAFCKQHSIPYRITLENAQGERRAIHEDDRKGVILERIRHLLTTGEVLPETCFKAAVVCFESLPRQLSADDRLFYGQYDKKNEAMMAVLRALTAGRFRNGAIARILARKFWGEGKAPTYREYATAWLQAAQDHTQPNAEWAFLADRANHKATADWKLLRNKKAGTVLKLLQQLLC